MVLSKKIALLLIFATVVLATKDEKMKELESLSRSFFGALSDFELTVEEANKKIGKRINRILNVQREQKTDQFWLELLNQKTKLNADQETHNLSAEVAKETLVDFVKNVAPALDTIGSSTNLETLKTQISGSIPVIKQRLIELLNKEIIAQFIKNSNQNQQSATMVFTSIASDALEVIRKKLNYIHVTFAVEVEQEFASIKTDFEETEKSIQKREFKDTYDLLKVYLNPQHAIRHQVEQMIKNALNHKTADLSLIEEKIKHLFSLSAGVSHLSDIPAYFGSKKRIIDFSINLVNELEDKTQERSTEIKMMIIRHFFRESPTSVSDIKLTYEVAQEVLNRIFDFKNQMSASANEMLTIAARQYLTLDLNEYSDREQSSSVFGDLNKKNTLKAVTLIMMNEPTAEVSDWFRANFLPNFDRFVISNSARKRLTETKRFLFMEMTEKTGRIEEYISAKVELLFSYATISEEIYQSLNPTEQTFEVDISIDGKNQKLKLVDHFYLLHSYLNLYVLENIDENTSDQLVQAHQNMKSFYPYLMLECLASRHDNTNQEDPRTFKWAHIYTSTEDEAWLNFVNHFKSNFWYSEVMNEDVQEKEPNAVITFYLSQDEDESIDEYLTVLFETLEGEEDISVTEAQFIIEFELNTKELENVSELNLGRVNSVGREIIDNKKEFKFDEILNKKDDKNGQHLNQLDDEEDEIENDLDFGNDEEHETESVIQPIEKENIELVTPEITKPIEEKKNDDLDDELDITEDFSLGNDSSQIPDEEDQNGIRDKKATTSNIEENDEEVDVTGSTIQKIIDQQNDEIVESEDDEEFDDKINTHENTKIDDLIETDDKVIIPTTQNDIVDTPIQNNDSNIDSLIKDDKVIIEQPKINVVDTIDELQNEQRDTEHEIKDIDETKIIDPVITQKQEDDDEEQPRLSKQVSEDNQDLLNNDPTKLNDVKNQDEQDVDEIIPAEQVSQIHIKQAQDLIDNDQIIEEVIDNRIHQNEIDEEIEQPPVIVKKIEDEKTKKNLIHFIRDTLSPSEIRKIEDAPDLVNFFERVKIIIDPETGDETHYHYIQVVPRSSDCYETINA